MSSIKISFEDSIDKNVIKAEKCLGCGTCVVVCTFNCLEYVDEKPRLVKECKICGICAQACPQYEWSTQKAENFMFGRERKPEEEFGIYRRLAITQAANNQILNVSQDGGQSQPCCFLL